MLGVDRVLIMHLLLEIKSTEFYAHIECHNLHCKNIMQEHLIIYTSR